MIMSLFVLLVTTSTTFAQAVVEPTSEQRESIRIQVEKNLGREVTDEELDTVIANLPGSSLTPGPSLPATPETFGTVSCFDYYDFGSVFPAISTPVQSSVTGTTMTFTVDMENSNPYPVVDGTLYVKIFRSQPEESFTYTQANHVVDQFKVETDIAIDANTTKSLTFEWEVPLYAGNGAYYAATFFATNDRYNLSGLSFTDDIIGGSVPFTLNAETDEIIYFDKNNVTLNGKDYRFIGPPLNMDREEAIQVSFPVVNTFNSPQQVIIEWTTNEWDTLREELVLNTQSETMVIPANTTTDITYTVTETGAPVYLVEPRLIINGQTVSAMNIRFVRENTDRPRINFPSIMSYPLKAGEENTLFSCLHNAGQAASVPDGELTLTLTDNDNNTVHTYMYTGIITGAMMGLKDTFTPDKDISNFTLNAVLKQGGETLEDVTVTYSCSEITPDLCPKPTEEEQTNADTFIVLIVTFLLLFLAGGVYLHTRKKEETFTSDSNDTL